MEETPVYISLTTSGSNSLRVSVKGISHLPFKSSELLQPDHLASWIHSKVFDLHSLKWRLYFARLPVDDSVLLILLECRSNRNLFRIGHQSYDPFAGLPVAQTAHTTLIRDKAEVELKLTATTLGVIYLLCYSGPVLLCKVKLLPQTRMKSAHTNLRKKRGLA